MMMRQPRESRSTRMLRSPSPVADAELRLSPSLDDDEDTETELLALEPEDDTAENASAFRPSSGTVRTVTDPSL